MRAKTVIYYRPNGEIKKIRSNAGQTRHNKAAMMLMRGQYKPTMGMRIAGLFGRPYKAKRKNKFGHKFKRFMRRLKTEIDETVVSHIVGSEQACKSPYIGFEE